MKKTTVIITGCDANFYSYMDQCLKSLFALNLDNRADIGILDLGLTLEQVNNLKAMGCKVVQPEWTLPVPEELRIKYEVGLVARTALRDYFTGYKTYLWFDADAWAQTPEFFDLMVDGATKKGAAIIREDGKGYSRNYLYNRWWYGHMIASFGLINGIKIAYKPAINIGILALSDTAPHWDAWIKDYKHMLENRMKTNIDQHSFNSSLELNNLPSAHMPTRCNWIPVLSVPHWNAETKMLHEPVNNGKPLSIIHLAGPDKERNYTLKKTSKGIFTTKLTHNIINDIYRHA